MSNSSSNKRVLGEISSNTTVAVGVSHASTQADASAHRQALVRDRVLAKIRRDKRNKKQKDRFFESLPDDVLHLVLSHLNAGCLIALRSVSRVFWPSFSDAIATSSASFIISVVDENENHIGRRRIYTETLCYSQPLVLNIACHQLRSFTMNAVKNFKVCHRLKIRVSHEAVDSYRAMQVYDHADPLEHELSKLVAVTRPLTLSVCLDCGNAQCSRCDILDVFSLLHPRSITSSSSSSWCSSLFALTLLLALDSRFCTQGSSSSVIMSASRSVLYRPPLWKSFTFLDMSRFLW